MAAPRHPGFDTLVLHAGQSPDAQTHSRAVPIYQTTSAVFRDAEHAASLFNMERPGHVYSRVSNPTVAVFEERVAALEGGVGAIATASGQAALHLAIATLMGAGGHVVASSALYGGSHNLLAYTLARFGIETTFVKPRDLQAWRAAIRPETRLLFGETLGNPGLDVLDIPSVAAIAHAAGVPLLVDATFTTPYLMKPFELGADLLFHSATKFLGGHGTAIGGVLVDAGAFDWSRNEKFPTLAAPYAGFHDMVFEEESGTRAFLLRARREGLRDFGACMAPMTAFLLLQGLETLALRMPRHVENARKLVAFLASHKAVERVHYPELPGHPDHALAGRLPPKGAGAVFSFDIKGGRAAGKRFIESLRVFSHLANVGDAKSLVIHPASTTHYRMSEEDLAQAGIGAGMVRLSIGLEDPEDLIADLAHGLRTAERGLSVLLQVRGRRAYAYTADHAPEPARPSVVFVHGAGLDHSWWALQSRYFGYHGWNVLAVDLPGHGRSAGPALSAIQDTADWTLELAEAAGLERFSIVGHSMGSLVALECAARHAERVQRAALVAVSFPMKVSDEFLRAAREGTVAAHDMHTIWGHVPQAPLRADPNPGMSMYGDNLARLRRLAPGVLHTDLKACDDYANGLESAAALRCPVLYLLGASDVMTPPRGAQALIQATPDAKVVRLEHIGHALMGEAPEATLDALIEFFSGV